MGKREPKAVDDAGAEIRAIDLRDLPNDDPEIGKQISLLVKRLNKSTRLDGGTSNRGQLLSIVLIIGLFVVYGMFKGQLGISPLMSVPSFLAFLVVVYFINRSLTASVGRHIRKDGIACTVAARGFCGGCGYDLREAHSYPNGLTPCPECGAHWSVARLKSSPLDQPIWDTLGKGKGRANKKNRLDSDDRGALIRRILSIPRSAPSAGRKQWTPGHLSAMRQIRRQSGFRARVLATPLGVIFLAIAAFIAIGVQLEDDPSAAIAAGISAFFGTVFLVSLWMSDFGVKGKPFVRLVCDAGICAACATPLDIKTKDADGFCVCASCGSSWKPGGAAAMLDAI